MSDGAERADLPTALEADSVRTGAVISFSGDTLIASGADIVAGVESRLIASAPGDRRDHWLRPGVPVLSRGDAWIVPLSWTPPRGEADEAAKHALADRSHELWMSIRSACEYRHGMQIGVDLDAATPYARELARTGARRADRWGFDGAALVLVVYGEPIPEPATSMALHIVPEGWVSDRRPTPPKKMRQIDLSWSWADVVALAGSQGPDAQLPPE